MCALRGRRGNGNLKPSDESSVKQRRAFKQNLKQRRGSILTAKRPWTHAQTTVARQPNSLAKNNERTKKCTLALHFRSRSKYFEAALHRINGGKMRKEST